MGQIGPFFFLNSCRQAKGGQRLDSEGILMYCSSEVTFKFA
jgi:hypothetical protein